MLPRCEPLRDAVIAGRPLRKGFHQGGREPKLASNLKLTVAATPTGNPEGEVYAKVTAAAAGASRENRIRFTSVSPELKAWLRNLM